MKDFMEKVAYTQALKAAQIYKEKDQGKHRIKELSGQRNKPFYWEIVEKCSVHITMYQWLMFFLRHLEPPWNID